MRLKLAGLTAAALLAAPAMASGSTIEHTVTKVSFEANYSVDGLVPRSERIERWVSGNLAHQVIKHADSGLVRGESAEEPQKFTSFDALRNEVWTLTGPDANSPRGVFVHTLARAGSHVKEQVAKGWLHKTGTTTFLGRPAIKLADSPGAPSEGDTSISIIADAETYAPYERVVKGRDGDRTYTQRETLESVESLPLAGNEHVLYMGSDSANAKRVTFSEQAKAVREANRRASKPKAAKKKAKKKQSRR